MQNAIIKNTALAAVLATGTMFTTVAQAVTIEGNVGLTTDYIWRGMTQSDGESSFSGGVDLSTESGFYAGTWVGDVRDTAGVGASYELDVYAGYAGEAGSINYDVGYIQYMYPDVDDDQDFGEVYVGLGTGPVSITYYYEVDNDNGAVDSGDNEYISVDYSADLTEDWSVSLHWGEYEREGQDDQIDMSVTLSKGDFSFSVVETDDIAGPDNDDTRAVISYGMTF